MSERAAGSRSDGLRARLLAEWSVLIRKFLGQLKARDFVRAVGVLVGGTGLAAAISALVLPVLTRLYTPGDFSVLAVFTSLLSIFSVSACLRFDVAVAIPEKDGDAINVLGLALLCACAVSLFLLFAIFAMPSSAFRWFGQSDIEKHLWLLPIGVLFVGAYSALQFWFVREKSFSLIAKNRIMQTAGAAGVQAGWGWLHATPLGLIAGPVLNGAVGCCGLGYRLVNGVKTVEGLSWSRMRVMFSQYHRFPKYSALEALCNVAAIQLPIVMIAGMAARTEAGFLILALTVMQAPMSILGSAIAQVYLSQAPAEYRLGRLGDFTVQVCGSLIRTGIGPLIFGGLLAPDLAVKIFGEEWRRAGALMAWMTPWFAMQFLASPVSMALHVANQQRFALLLQIFGLVLRVGAVVVVPAGLLSEAYAMSGFLFYGTYLVVVLMVVHSSWLGVARELLSSSKVVCIWIVLALGVKVVAAAFSLL